MATAQPSTASAIPCCLCGTSILPNTANMCTQCLRSQVDVTAGVSRQETLTTCKVCGRFRGVTGKWLLCAAESHELMALCLKQITGLGKGKHSVMSQTNRAGFRMVDAQWVWTEPHSRRLKVKLLLEMEAVNGALIQQAMITEFLIKTLNCDFCTKDEMDQAWTTVVQVRQKVDHKRTLLFLEQVILQNRASVSAQSMQVVANGMDFYYSDRGAAFKFAEFVRSHVPCRRRESKQLKSVDAKNNKSRYQFTISLECVPLCKTDLLLLPRKLQGTVSHGSPVVLVDKVTRALHLVDCETATRSELREAVFFQTPFRPLLSADSLVEMIVLDVQPAESNGGIAGVADAGGSGVEKSNGSKGQRRKGKRAKKKAAAAANYAASYPSSSGPPTTTQDVTGEATETDGNAVSASSIAVSETEVEAVVVPVPSSISVVPQLVDVEVALASDFGQNDRTFLVKSHLAGKGILNTGDTVLGYDLSNYVIPEESVGDMKGAQLPSVVLVKKKRERAVKRGHGSRKRRAKSKQAAAAVAAAESKIKSKNNKDADGSGAEEEEGDDGVGALYTDQDLLKNREAAKALFHMSAEDVELVMDELDDMELNEEEEEEEEEELGGDEGEE